MRGQSYWSYHPYRPLLTEVGDPYICRIAPGKGRIHLEWLAKEKQVYDIYCRECGETDFHLAGRTDGENWEITGLKDQTDYEVQVVSGEHKSRIRMVRSAEAIGTVVNYLHPADDAYCFSGKYLCSPSLIRHPEGYLLASMDLYEGNSPQNLTLIFRSDDEGETWHYVSELMPCFWGKLFVHRGELYMLACSTEYGDLLIGKSMDGGRNFTAPVTLLRGSNGKNGNSGVHKNPQNIVVHKGRIYETLEWGSWSNQEYCHAAMVMSCDENADLLVPENWSFSEPVPFTHFSPEVADVRIPAMTIEGTLVVDPEGRLLNIMRFGKYATALVYEVDTENPDAPIQYRRCMDFCANYSKFMIKFDEVSGYYISVGTRVYDKERTSARNLLSFLVSRDLEKWEVICDLYDFRDRDHERVGLQYVDFSIEDEDIIYLCRTAMNQANNFHDANYSTFHRIKKFRELLPL